MKGYRRLKVGDEVLEGDMFLYKEELRPAFRYKGETVDREMFPHYRPITPKSSMWIEVYEGFVGCWYYDIKRINGKGELHSNPYISKSACVWMAKRTAKALGVEYRGEVK